MGTGLRPAQRLCAHALTRAFAILIGVTLVLALGPGGAALAQMQAPEIPAPNGAPPGQSPKIKVLEPLYNFGTVLEGTMVRHTFKIQNVGKSALIIRGVKTSCGCTAARPTKLDLAPSEVAAIDVGFDTRFQKGTRHRVITVFTNDPNTPAAVMTMQGTVRPQLAANPSQLDFGTIKHGTAVEKNVVVTDLSKAKGFKAGPVSNSNKNIKVTLEPAVKNGHTATLKVALLKTMPVGSFDDTINLVTNRVPMSIYVFGKVQGDLSVSPAQVSFGIVPHGQSAVRFVRVTNRSAREVSVVGVTSSNHSVAASVQPLKSGKDFKITVTLRRNTPDGQLHGELAIKTTDPQQTTLTVPFYAIVGKFEG